METLSRRGWGEGGGRCQILGILPLDERFQLDSTIHKLPLSFAIDFFSMSELVQHTAVRVF